MMWYSFHFSWTSNGDGTCRGSTKTSPANMNKFKSEFEGLLWHVGAAVLVQEAVIPDLSCTCLLEPVEWACPQNTDRSTNSLLFGAALAAASFQPVSPQEPGQRWARRWARALVLGAAGMRDCGVGWQGGTVRSFCACVELGLLAHPCFVAAALAPWSCCCGQLCPSSPSGEGLGCARLAVVGLAWFQGAWCGQGGCGQGLVWEC